jgi:hypothetical protein
MLGSILFLLVAFAFIFFVARGCVATQESTEVRKYVTNSASILNDSSNSGNEELQSILQGAEGDASKLDTEALDQAAAGSRELYNRALLYEEVPSEFETAHHYVMSSLGIRATATEEIAEAAAGEPDGFKEVLARSVESYRMSDALVRNHYLPAATEGLKATGQQAASGFVEEPPPFMDYDELGFGADQAADAAAVQDDPNALHGVEITSVEIAGQPLYPGGNVVLTGSDEVVFTVTVTNGGEVPETAVPVEVVLNTKAERQSQTATIEQIEPNNGNKVIEVSSFNPGELDETAEVTVEAGPVEYEKFEDNNTLTGTVTFGI